MTFDDLLDKLKKKEHFSLSRWGDGEFNCIFRRHDKKMYHNTDQHMYFPDMGRALLNVLETAGRGEMFALQNLAKRTFKDNPEFKRLVADNKWPADAEIFSRNHKRLPELLKAFESNPVILVANKYYRKLSIFKEFVEIPERNCWIEKERLYTGLQGLIKSGDVIVYAASMMANVLIDDLYRLDYTQIDVGSAFDPFLGRITRNYMKKL